MFKQTLFVAALVASATAFAPAPRTGVSSSLCAEWKPKEGEKWEEKDFEAQIKKLEKEAEERLDAKIEEMMRGVESVGKSS
jgi:hypothetical protein